MKQLEQWESKRDTSNYNIDKKIMKFSLNNVPRTQAKKLARKPSILTRYGIKETKKCNKNALLL